MAVSTLVMARSGDRSAGLGEESLVDMLDFDSVSCAIPGEKERETYARLGNIVSLLRSLLVGTKRVLRNASSFVPPLPPPAHYGWLNRRLLCGLCGDFYQVCIGVRLKS